MLRGWGLLRPAIADALEKCSPSQRLQVLSEVERGDTEANTWALSVSKAGGWNALLVASWVSRFMCST